MAQTFTRVSQQAARYKLLGGVERCGRCRFFLRNNLCARVIGDVSPSAWCKFFSMEARAAMDAGGGAAATHAGSGGPPGVALDLNFMTPGTLDPRITFTRASIGTYFDVAGVLQTATANTPRWDYDPVTHALRGLLIEEQRINVLLNSATLGTQSVAVTAQAYTLSFYGTGTVTLSGVSTAGPLVGTGAFPTRVALTFTPTAGTLTLTVTGSVLNAQLEAGTFATSYIPTTAAAVTRARDICTQPIAAWFDATKGSLLFEYMVEGAVVGFTSPVQFIGASANTDYIAVDEYTSAGATPTSPTLAAVEVFTASAQNAITNYTAVAVPAGVVHKGGASWIVGARINAAHDGIASVSFSGNITALPVIATLSIAGPYHFQPQVSLWARRVTYWPRALTSAELQQATT